MELTLIPESQMVLQRFFCEIVFKQRVVHSLGLLMEKRIMLQATRWPRLRQQFWGSVEQMQPEYNLHRKIFIDKIVFSIRIQYPDLCIFNTESNLSLKTGLWMAFDSFGTWSTAHYFTSRWHLTALEPGVPLITLHQLPFISSFAHRCDLEIVIIPIVRTIKRSVHRQGNCTAALSSSDEPCN